MKLRILLLLTIFLSSCGTTSTIIIDTISESDLAQMDELELYLIRYQFEKDPALLDRAKIVLDDINNRDTANKEYQARRACLYAEWLLLSDPVENRQQATALLSKAAHWNPVEGRLFVVESMLSEDMESAYETLLIAVESPTASRTYLLLGDLYFDDNRFTEAVAAYDAAFTRMPSSITAYYRPKRDLAYSIQNMNFRSSRSASYIQGGPIPLDSAIALLYLETGMLRGIINSLESGTYFEALERGGFFSSDNLSKQNLSTRKEIAYLLAHIIATNQRDPQLLKETRDYYLQNGWESPIPDISIQSPYFSSIVLLVEEGIMILPDGKRFNPDNLVSTEEYLDILKTLQRLFP